MPATSTITEADVRNLVDSTIFGRGQAYFQQGAVLRLVQRGDALEADVEGSDWEPYRVQITFDAGAIATTACSCPYGVEWGGVCKHTVATLLAFLHAPDTTEQRTPVDELLRDLDADQLRALLGRLAARQPALADLLEAELLVLTAPVTVDPATGSPAPTAATIRQQVRSALHSLARLRRSEGYWHVGALVHELSGILSASEGYVEAGNARGALAVLETVTEEFVAGFELLDDSSGEVGAFFETLGERWTAALLSAELPRAEGERWAERLTDWQDTLDAYGIDAFHAPIDAAEQGWDDRALVRVLRGESDMLWPHGRPFHADLLTQARLAALERTGRNEDYLNLARAEAQSLAYTTKLIALGRVEDAVAYGRAQIATPFDALALAQLLEQHGAFESALEIAEQGLALKPRGLPVRFPGAAPSAIMLESPLTNGQTHLARWLRDRASAHDQPERALRAALFTARTSADLSDHLAVQALAGARWPTLRRELLQQYHKLRGYSETSNKIDVFLHEQLWDEAIAVADQLGSDRLVERVADAVLHHRPPGSAARRGVMPTRSWITRNRAGTTRPSPGCNTTGPQPKPREPKRTGAAMSQP